MSVGGHLAPIQVKLAPFYTLYLLFPLVTTLPLSPSNVYFWLSHMPTANAVYFGLGLGLRIVGSGLALAWNGGSGLYHEKEINFI